MSAKAAGSARKKPWIRSAFSDLNLTPNTSADVVPVKRTRSASASIAARASSTTRTPKKSDLMATVDLTNNDDDESTNETQPIIKENWMDSFAPASSEELAVHSKKLEEVRNWLKHCAAMQKKYPAQICLLTGPTGAAKTATMRLLAQEAGYELQEWINPVDCEVVDALGDQPSGSAYMENQLEAFKSYLLRASRYKSLLTQQHKRLLLVEDFPNIFLKDSATTSFEELLEQYSSYGKSPLVFIVADARTRGLNISYKLFTDQLKTKYRIEHISFNAIASTIMQKSMKRFVNLIKQQHAGTYKVPTQTVMDSIVVCAQGDIRNALINLHFASLKGAPSVPTQQLDVSLNKGRKRKQQSTLKSIGRDESITMMHALGRVFNPKVTDKNRLQHSPEEISEAFRTEPKQFTNFIHANYIPHFCDISYAVSLLNDLTLADLMLQQYGEDTTPLIGLNIAVRSCMVSNEVPVTGWMPVRGPKRITVQPLVSIAEQNLLGVRFAGISKSLYASDYSSFVKCIATQRTETNATTK